MRQARALQSLCRRTFSWQKCRCADPVTHLEIELIRVIALMKGCSRVEIKALVVLANVENEDFRHARSCFRLFDAEHVTVVA